MGACDYEDGYDPNNREIDGRSEQLPHHHRNEGGRDRDARQHLGRTIGQMLGPGLRLLCLGHEAHDLRQLRVLAGARHVDPERAFSIDRPGDHLIALALPHRSGLARDQGLVDRTLALAHDTVHGHAFSGPHEDDFAGPQLADRDHFLVPCGDPRRRRWKQLRQLLERAFRALNGPHLDPVTEQHDRHERRELPPQRVGADQLQFHDPGEDKCDRNSQRDERHHSRQTRPQLAPGALEKRATAVQEDERTEHGRDPVGSRHRRRPVVQEHFDMAGPDHRRNGEYGRDPEAVAEHARRVSRMSVMRVRYWRASGGRLLAVWTVVMDGVLMPGMAHVRWN